VFSKVSSLERAKRWMPLAGAKHLAVVDERGGRLVQDDPLETLMAVVPTGSGGRQRE